MLFYILIAIAIAGVLTAINAIINENIRRKSAHKKWEEFIKKHPGNELNES